MIKPGGIIQRIAREPTIHLEYISALDYTPQPVKWSGAAPSWTEDETAALFFNDFAVADELAKQMGGRPIFAITRPTRLGQSDDQTERMRPTRPRRMHPPKHRHQITGAYPTIVEAVSL
jgi:hypothetical protein